MKLHPDFKDFLAVLASEGVEYLLVGGYAVAFHARPRATKDIDFWVSSTPENLERLVRALTRFGAPGSVVLAARTAGDDDVLWMGQPPTRIDIIRTIAGVDFARAYPNRVRAEWDNVPVVVIGGDDLITNKRAADRDQDRLDVSVLLAAKAQRGT